MLTAKISDSLDVHNLDDLHLKALWALDRLSTSAKDRFSATEVAHYLVESCHTSTSRQAITYALEKNRAACHKDKRGYKLMEPGRRNLSALVSNRVIVIESNKPFSTKNLILKDLFARLTSPISICDPYIDVHTLDILYKNVDKSIPMKILTRNIADKPLGIFPRHLADLRREGFQIEIGQYTQSELHDRYLMDDSSFWLSGNSLNHLGNKESFLVLLGEDIRANMLTVFSNRWAAATKI